jgi:glycine/D-amino acid oxidase-like deaminating enzyme
VGTATAYAAAVTGGEQVEVDLYEAATVGHDGGASIDVTRVFRHAYGNRRHYSRWTVEAQQLWQHVEEQSEQTLFEATGAAWLASATEQRANTTRLERPLTPEAARHLLETSYQTLSELGLPCELIDGDELRRRYPQFADPEITLAMIDRSAGVLHARDAVLALRDLGVRHGVRLHEQKPVVEVRPEPNACLVRFADGTSAEADVVVMAINGWTASLLPDLPERLIPAAPDGAQPYGPGIQNTEQPLWYFTLPTGVADAFAPGRFPVFLFANAEVYGLPLHRGSVKIANDAPSRLLGRPELRRLTADEYRAELHEYLVRQLPALRDATLMQERVCFYDRSPDGDFILDQWDGHARLLVACGFSGHGFKFGPLTGARLAHYALTGHRSDDLAPFTLARFGTSAQPEDSP